MVSTSRLYTPATQRDETESTRTMKGFCPLPVHASRKALNAAQRSVEGSHVKAPNPVKQKDALARGNEALSRRSPPPLAPLPPLPNGWVAHGGTPAAVLRGKEKAGGEVALRPSPNTEIQPQRMSDPRQ